MEGTAVTNARTPELAGSSSDYTYTVADSVPEAFGPSADCAASAAFLELGERLGVLEHLVPGKDISATELAAAANLPEPRVRAYLDALVAAALLQRSPEGHYRTAPDFAFQRYGAGYLSWALNANRPFIECGREFFADPATARAVHQRDGRQVAVSSEWMGSLGFYPPLLGAILDARPRRIADLGAGSGALVIDVLGVLPECTGVALDLASGACAAAREAARRAGVASRLTVVERSIQSVADDPAVLDGADVISAGFVFHDMMPEEEDVADAVLANCRRSLRPGGFMAITEAVPYAGNGRERRFSALVSYYHTEFMGRRLLDESQWAAKLAQAGFGGLRVIQPPFPTGRLFIASAD
jgi:SAM-dependent methyltransferase